MASRFRRLLPFLVAFLAMAFVISHTNLVSLQAALSRAPLGLLISVSIVLSAVNCAADTLAMYYVFRWFGLQLRYFDLYTIRAATYLLAVINYHAGQLGIVAYLHRVGRIPLSRAGGWILFIIGVWVGLLLLLASFGALLGGPQGRALIPVLLLFGLGVVTYVIILLTQPRWLRVPPESISTENRYGAPGRLVRRLWALLVAIFEPLLQAGVMGHIRAVMVRLPHLVVLLVWHYFALRCFGIQVPALTAMLYLPVVFAVASLPISVQGLGTSQLAAVFFFSAFAPDGESTVVAYSLSMTAIGTVNNLLLGLLFLHRGTRLGLSMHAEPPAAAAGLSPLPPEDAGAMT